MSRSLKLNICCSICKMKVLSASDYPGKPEKVPVGEMLWCKPAGIHAS